MQMTFNKLYLAIVCGALSSTAIADQCSSPSGASTLKFEAELDGTDTNENQWKAIAEAIQNTYGNNVAPDPYTGVYISGSLLVEVPTGIPFVTRDQVRAYGPLPIPFDGTKSIEKAILDSQGIDIDEDDPNPCSAPGEEDSDSGSGGGSSGSGSGYSPTTSYMPIPTWDQMSNWNFYTPPPTNRGEIGVEEAEAMAKYYGSFYSNYYSNYNPN